MRVGDIYFKQMDVPDRDYSKAEHAEEEYRTMLKQYPDAPKEILAEAQQKLRDVQEVLAQREAASGRFTPRMRIGLRRWRATRPSTRPTRSTATWTMC